MQASDKDKNSDNNNDNNYLTDYITDRLLPQIEFYEKASKKLQAEYYIISTLSTIVLAVVPILTMLIDYYPFLKYGVAGSSAIASICSAILLLHRTKDNWLEYRATSEELKAELARFFVENPEITRWYDTLRKGQDNSTANCMLSSTDTKETRRVFLELVKTCEKIIQVEQRSWYSRMKSESDQNSVKIEDKNDIPE